MNVYDQDIARCQGFVLRRGVTRVVIDDVEHLCYRWDALAPTGPDVRTYASRTGAIPADIAPERWVASRGNIYRPSHPMRSVSRMPVPLVRAAYFDAAEHDALITHTPGGGVLVRRVGGEVVVGRTPRSEAVDVRLIDTPSGPRVEYNGDGGGGGDMIAHLNGLLESLDLEPYLY